MANPTATYKLPDGRLAINVTEAKTLVAADSGIVQNVIADAVTVTLPATVVGHAYTIRNGGVPKTSGPAGTGDDGSAKVLTMPTGTDGFTGAGITAAASKGLDNTKATSKVGDEFSVIGSGVNSAVAWVITSVKGTWVRTT